jgi:hypothetical protein
MSHERLCNCLFHLVSSSEPLAAGSRIPDKITGCLSNYPVRLERH